MSINRVLDLGCGNRKEHWIPNSDGVDIGDFGQKFRFNLESMTEWPIESSSYDMVYANHILEHIREPMAFIHILNEVYRVLTPSGRFAGAAPHYTMSPNFTRDPTHCRNISQFTFDAFLEGSTIHFNDYGVKCVFRKVDSGIWVNENKDVCWLLGVVK